MSYYAIFYRNGEKYSYDVSEMTQRQINKIYRQHDESHLYPVFGCFNVTNRAIRRLSKYIKEYGYEGGMWYSMALDREIGNIVNKM